MDNYSQNINKYQEYYFLDNISNFYSINTIHTYFFFENSKKEKDEASIYILYNDKFISLPFPRNNMKKLFDFYSFIKIYNGYNYINILIYEDYKNTPDSILDKINSIKPFKKEIEQKLRINFPIRDYVLIEKNENAPNHKNNDILRPHKIFDLKKIDKENLKVLNKMKRMQTEKKSIKSINYINKFMKNNNSDNHHLNICNNNNINIYNNYNNNEKFLMNNFMNNIHLYNNLNVNGNNNINNNNNLNNNNNFNNNLNHNNLNYNNNNNFNNNNYKNNNCNFNNFNNNFNIFNNLNMKVNNDNNMMFNRNKDMKANSNNMLNKKINMNQNNMNMNMLLNLRNMKICNNKIENIIILNYYNNYINKLLEKKFQIIKENQKIFPLKGLRNVGLTCYMNSTLQCLLHVPELNIFFINIYSKERKIFNIMNNKIETKGRISEEYYKVLNGLISIEFDNYYDFAPYDFNKTLNKYNPQFVRQEANDAKDLLIYLFQVMHEELNYFGDQKLTNIPKCNQLDVFDSFNFFFMFNAQLYFSIISYLFYGIAKTRTICSQCKNHLYNFQYFQFLSFPLINYKNDYFNLYKGFKDYIKKENLTGDNQIYCQFCKKLSDGSVQARIFYPPPYLLINFDYGKNKRYMPKKINFAEVIDLKDFLEIPEQESCYELISVSTHIGASGSGGHYISFCKDNNRKWHKFNDSIHSKCDYNDIFSFSPYLLLYKRIQK